MAEIPALPGCRVWGDTPAETLYILEGMAEAFIQSYQERGEPLPAGVGGEAGADRRGYCHSLTYRELTRKLRRSELPF